MENNEMAPPGVGEFRKLLGDYCRSDMLKEDFYSLKPSERLGHAMKYLTLSSPRRQETKLKVASEPPFRFAERVRSLTM